MSTPQRARPARGAQPRTLRVLSGVQPTGALHLGNYLGAIRQWVAQQHAYDALFCVVDLHAITVPHDPRRLAHDTLSTAAMYLACGIDPAKSTVFVQSHVPAHAELTWLLNCMTPMGWLDKMTQYKDKRNKLRQRQSAALRRGDDGAPLGGAAAEEEEETEAAAASVYVGLYGYPVLMASDILLYQADRVPVGEDQRQHLELARDIARAFNHTYCRRRKPKKLPSVFREPQTLIHPAAAGGGDTDGGTGAGDNDGGGVARVMSLTDGTVKMSKSADSDASRINLLDDADTIRAKIKRCKTDSSRGLERHNAARPECANLLNIYRALSPPSASEEAIAREVAHMSWGAFKPLLAEAVIEHLAPIQRRYREVMDDRAELSRVLHAGRDRASSLAADTLRRAKAAMGFAVLDSVHHDDNGDNGESGDDDDG